MSISINEFTTLKQNNDHIHIAFSSPKRVVSSAVLNGGFILADHILNKKVQENSSCCESPDTTLRDYSNSQGWKGNVVGMMTAASMSSHSVEHARAEGVEITVIATTGINNARRAGDKADVKSLLEAPNKVGTINLVLICSAYLTDSAMVEAIMVATEGKAAALQNANVISPVSQQIATGTGTDSIVIVSGDGPEKINFCGKHVLLGELIGRLVINAVTRSLLK